MLQSCQDFAQLFLTDTPLLDVRAPVEFAQGAFPMAENIPLLDNEQRQMIGIEYKEQGQDVAIALGEGLVSGGIKQQRIDEWARFVQTHPGGVLYCFRGGLRSRISQQWIKEATGKDCPLVTGGYKALRRFLIEQTQSLMETTQAMVLSGRTGVGKTQLLLKLDNAIDLEGLANHRGSSFGRQISPQPTQINYENTLAIALLKHHHIGRQKLVFEDEGPNIGSLHTPQCVFNTMAQAPCVLLEEPLETRVANTLQEYVVQSLKQHQTADSQNGFMHYSQHLLQALARVQRRLGHQRYQAIRAEMKEALAQQQADGSTQRHEKWIVAMLTQYYDPMYDYQISKKQNRVVFSGDSQQVQAYLQQNS